MLRHLRVVSVQYMQEFCLLTPQTCSPRISYSDTSTDYVWEVPKPFTISPSSGTLPPKATAMMKVTFSPEASH